MDEMGERIRGRMAARCKEPGPLESHFEDVKDRVKKRSTFQSCMSCGCLTLIALTVFVSGFVKFCGPVIEENARRAIEDAADNEARAEREAKMVERYGEGWRVKPPKPPVRKKHHIKIVEQWRSAIDYGEGEWFLPTEVGRNGVLEYRIEEIYIASSYRNVSADHEFTTIILRITNTSDEQVNEPVVDLVREGEYCSVDPHVWTISDGLRSGEPLPAKTTIRRAAILGCDPTVGVGDWALRFPGEFGKRPWNYFDLRRAEWWAWYEAKVKAEAVPSAQPSDPYSSDKKAYGLIDELIATPTPAP